MFFFVAMSALLIFEAAERRLSMALFGRETVIKDYRRRKTEWPHFTLEELQAISGKPAEILSSPKAGCGKVDEIPQPIPQDFRQPESLQSVGGGNTYQPFSAA